MGIMDMQKAINNINKYITEDMLTNMAIDTSPYQSSKSNTGYTGVYKHANNKYRVQLVYDYKKYSLGVYSNKEMAARKYALTNLLLKNTIKGGVSFNIGSEEKKCK